MRYFNTEGQCNPKIHYMVNIDDRLRVIKEHYVERGSYFVINRGRQYGKTTTLWLLEEYLRPDYLVLFLDFQELTTANFETESKFVEGFIRCFVNALKEHVGKDFATVMDGSFDMGGMFARFSRICEMSERPVVLMIDEVDSALNNQVFLDFLALLRRYYLNRSRRKIFHSVILAGVYDIKNLKLKIRPGEEHLYNSPWNIAADFDMDMNFSVEQIKNMLCEYEADYRTGMDATAIAEEIYQYTSGYPYLISLICKIMDEKLSEDGIGESTWKREKVAEAVKILLDRPLAVFQSMIRQLSEYPDLKRMLNILLFQGKRVTFNMDNPVIELAVMFGYIYNREGSVQVTNRIFEMRLYNYFLSEEELTDMMYDKAQGNKNQYFCEGRLNMDMVLEKFVEHFTDIYGGSDERFVETYGRKFFLLYLKPIINGAGNYYVEAQTRDARRTDVVVDYLGEQFVVELKIWRGNEYNERGEEQLSGYLDYFHQKKGYMISFNFNKKKEAGVKVVTVGDKVIVEAVV